MKRQRSHISKETKPKKKKQGDYQKGRELARTPKQEIKAYDIAYTELTFNNGALTSQLLNAVVNGSELYQRVGRKLYMKSVHIRGFIFPASTNGSADIARVLIYYDSQPNGAAPTFANLLQDSNSAAGSTALSGINLNNRQRFKILRDVQIYMPPVNVDAGVQTNLGLADYVQQSMQINEFIKLKGLESVYNATNGGTIADITSGSLYLSVTSANNTAYSISFTSRLRYYD